MTKEDQIFLNNMPTDNMRAEWVNWVNVFNKNQDFSNKNQDFYRIKHKPELIDRKGENADE